MATAIITKPDGSVDIEATLRKLDKGLMYVVEKLKTPVDDRNREFVYKKADGKFAGALINLDSPVCPICNGALEPLTMSVEQKNEDGTIKYPSSPRGYCKTDKVYFNFSNRNLKGW